MLFDHATQIFWLTLSVAVACLTFFFCWMMYYVINMMRRTSQMMDKIESVISQIAAVTDFVKSKTEAATSYLPVLIAGIGQLKQMIDHWRQPDSDEPKTKRSKKDK
jgi:uncharacterized protein YoxC